MTMRCHTVGEGAFQHVKVELAPGETFSSEAGKMIRMSASIESDVTARPKGSGGLLGGLKRLVGGDSFFMSTYTNTGASMGEVYLAPTLVGECHVLELDGSTSWMCTGGSYMACGPDISLETKFQGVSGFMSGESLFFLEVSGRGPVVVNAFGSIREIEVPGSLIVDSGQVVAFPSTFKYEITKAGSSWWQSFLSGEGVVVKFTGTGKILVQSHNPSEFGSVLGPQLPARG